MWQNLNFRSCMVVIKMPIFCFIFPYWVFASHKPQIKTLIQLYQSTEGCQKGWVPGWCNHIGHFIISMWDEASPVQWCPKPSNYCKPQLAREAIPPLPAKPSAKTAPRCPGKGHLKAFGLGGAWRLVQSGMDKPHRVATHLTQWNHCALTLLSVLGRWV